MKRKLLTTALILLLGVPLHLGAQVFFSNPWVHAGTNALVRQQNIVYYEDGTGVGYFAYFPLSAPVHSVRVHPEWSIKDFQVVDTIAYFCDTNTHTHTAVLGHFSITRLRLGLGNVAFYYDNPIENLKILNRMAVHNQKGYVNILAIGTSEENLNPDLRGANCALYVENYLAASQCRIFTHDFGEEVFLGCGKDGQPICNGRYKKSHDGCDDYAPDECQHPSI